MMTLHELIATLGQLDDDQVIYTADGSPSASSRVDARQRGPVPVGWHYLLEVDTAREVLEVWSSWRQGRQPSPDEETEAILHYAKHDAYTPVTS